MNIDNIEKILPTIIEDFDRNHEIDGSWFPDIERYKSLMKVFYVKEKARNLTDLKISKIEKKKVLLELLKSQADILNIDFINKLKQIFPEGLCYENICTDKEYEALIKEFNL